MNVVKLLMWGICVVCNVMYQSLNYQFIPYLVLFQAVVRKKHGLAILVSNVAKETNATCSLKDPNEVLPNVAYSLC
jgi:hypothetical protein